MRQRQHFVQGFLMLTLSLTLTSGGSRISHRGGCGPRRGAVDLRGSYVSKILHVKTKESGPVGGGAPPLDPPMLTVNEMLAGRKR